MVRTGMGRSERKRGNAGGSCGWKAVWVGERDWRKTWFFVPFFRAGKVIFGEIDLLELLRREEIKRRFGGVLKNFQGQNCLLVWVGE